MVDSAPLGNLTILCYRETSNRIARYGTSAFDVSPCTVVFEWNTKVSRHVMTIDTETPFFFSKADNEFVVAVNVVQVADGFCFTLILTK